jgi:hypothetical protein
MADSERRGAGGTVFLRVSVPFYYWARPVEFGSAFQKVGSVITVDL